MKSPGLEVSPENSTEHLKNKQQSSQSLTENRRVRNLMRLILP